MKRSKIKEHHKLKFENTGGEEKNLRVHNNKRSHAKSDGILNKNTRNSKMMAK